VQFWVQQAYNQPFFDLLHACRIRDSANQYVTWW